MQELLRSMEHLLGEASDQTTFQGKQAAMQLRKFLELIDLAKKLLAKTPVESGDDEVAQVEAPKKRGRPYGLKHPDTSGIGN